MDIRQLIRDPQEVKNAIAVTGDGRWIAKKSMKILIPARYAERGLADIGNEIYIIAICCIILEDKYYSVLNIIAKMRITPSETNNIKIRGVDYLEFCFGPGETMVGNTKMIKKDTLVYSVYDEFIAKGKIPWYYNYSDYGDIFKSAKEYADANVGLNPLIIQTLVSILTKNPKNLNETYASVINTKEDLGKIVPVYVPLKSVEHASSNTMSRLGGSYFDRAAVAAMNDPSEVVTPMENILFK